MNNKLSEKYIKNKLFEKYKLNKAFIRRIIERCSCYTEDEIVNYIKSIPLSKNPFSWNYLNNEQISLIFN